MMNPSFKDFLLEGTLSDIVIRTKDVDFKAHKILLCGYSKYFRQLLCSEPSAPEQQVYIFPEVSPNIMWLILTHIYTGSVTVTEENVLELLAAADRFATDEVTQICSNFLEQKLCSNNCIDIWMLDVVNLHNSPSSDLRKKAYIYILDHFEEVAKSSERFLHLSVQQLVDLIENEELNVRQEDAVLKAIFRWIGHAPEERAGHMVLLLSKARPLLMSIESLLEASTNPLVSTNLTCLGILINALKNPCQRALTRTRLPSAVLLAVGGLVNSFPNSSIEMYDVRADRWVTVSKSRNLHQAFHGCVCLAGFIYCVGGFDGVKGLNRVRKLCLITQSCQEVSPMHFPRNYVSVVTLNGYIYAMGGYDGRVRLNSAERYQPETNQWTLIAPMHEYRSDASAATLHGKVYICGGFDRYNPLNSAECYDPHTNCWTLITPMDVRHNASRAVVYRDQIIVVGGYLGHWYSSKVIAYNPQTNKWTTLPHMISPRSSCGVAVLEDRLYVAGGTNSSGAIGIVERFDGDTNKWHRVHNMEVPRAGLSCCMVERNAYRISQL